MGRRLGPNETEALLRPDFGRVAVSEVGAEPANLRKPWGFLGLDRGSGEFAKVRWRRRCPPILNPMMSSEIHLYAIY
jgi:hypothetical protein